MSKKSSDTNLPAAGRHGAKAPETLSDAARKALSNRQLMREVRQAVSIPHDASRAEIRERQTAANALVAGINCKDVVEGMLATQMVAAHIAAMACLSRAASANDYNIHDRNVKYAAKLMSIYGRQVEVLNKHRGKGQQKVTVEHVHVEAGGQAVVGNVQTAAKPSGSESHSKDATREITHAADKPFEMTGRTMVPAQLNNGHVEQDDT
jgi:hypothetical protein